GIEKIRALRKEFWANVHVPGEANEMNQELEYALRVADYLDLGELMCVDALDRDASCGAHYRDDHLSGDGVADRADDNCCVHSAWESNGHENFLRHYAPLHSERIALMARNHEDGSSPVKCGVRRARTPVGTSGPSRLMTPQSRFPGWGC